MLESETRPGKHRGEDHPELTHTVGETEA